jgi:hypothetical protein
VPTIETPDTVRFQAPLLVRVTVWDGLVQPTAPGTNNTGDGDTLTAD